MSSTTSALQALLANRKAANTSFQKTIKPEPGTGRYRILPGWRKPDEDGNTDPTFYHDFGQHFIKDSAGQLKAVYICTERTFSRPCNICSLIANAVIETKNNGDDAMVKRLKEGESKSKVLLNVLHLNGPTPDIPQILEVPPSVFDGKAAKGGGEKVGGIVNIFNEFPDFLNPVEGNDIMISRSGTGLDTQYAVQIAGKSKPVPPEALTKLNDLDKFVAQESAERQRKALLAVSGVSGILPSPSMLALTSSPEDASAKGGSEWMPPEETAAKAPVEKAAVVEEKKAEIKVVSGDPEVDDLLKDLDLDSLGV